MNMHIWGRLSLGVLVVSLASAQSVSVDKIVGAGPSTVFGGDFGPATKAQLSDPSRVAMDGAGNLYIADESNSRIRKVAKDGTITTFAGTKGFYTGFLSGVGGPAQAAGMDTPYDVVTDSAGNLYIAAYGNSLVLKVDSSGKLTSVAGTGSNALGGDGSPATQAGIGLPSALAMDSSGNLYIADYQFGVVRRVTPDGTITTVAGTGTRGYSGDGGTATSAQLRRPIGLAVDYSGNLYIADYAANCVRKVTSGGIISTFAGTGTAGYSGDAGPAASAQLYGPQAVAVNGSGEVFIADSLNYRVRKVATNGVITTVAGTGTQGFGGDGGLATSASLDTPKGLLLDPSGNLYICDGGNNRVRLLTTDGYINTVAGSNPAESEGMPATWVALNSPSAVAVDSSGTVYVADWNNHRVRKVTSDGLVRTVAGTGVSGFSGDGGPAASAQLSYPFAVALDRSGNLYISDQGNNRIRRVGTDGNIQTVVGGGTVTTLDTPCGVTVDQSGNLYIADYYNGRVLKVSSGGSVTPLSNDVVPVGVAVDLSGNVYVTDVSASVIDGYTGYDQVVRITGNNETAWSGYMNMPYGITVDASGTVYVAEMGANDIRKITQASNKVTSDTVVFPTGSETWTTLTASLSSPFGVALDSSGMLYIADADNGRILKLRTSGDPGKRWPHVAPTYVVNSATYIAVPVAAGGLVTVYGDDLGPATGAGTQLDDTGKVANTLGGAQVFFDNIAAPLLYSQTTQINAVVPYAVNGKTVTEMWVVQNGLESNHILLPVMPASPGIFATSADYRLAAALNQDNSVNDVATNPAAPGSVIVLFAEGGGQTTPAGTDGLPANGVYPKPNLPVAVRIGGIDLDPTDTKQIQYAGAAPGFVAGALQINALIPYGITTFQTTSGYITEVIVSIGGVQSRSNLYIGVTP
jgi:trimeric autotransporter adhesin